MKPSKKAPSSESARKTIEQIRRSLAELSKKQAHLPDPDPEEVEAQFRNDLRTRRSRSQ